MDPEIERLKKSYESQLKTERAYGDVGRAVMNALRERGCTLPYVPVPGSGIEKIAAKYARMGKDFDTLMTAVNDDVMLTSEWERFSMMLRLAQED
jgi:hypothetical protein